MNVCIFRYSYRTGFSFRFLNIFEYFFSNYIKAKTQFCFFYENEHVKYVIYLRVAFVLQISDLFGDPKKRANNCPTVVKVFGGGLVTQKFFSDGSER